MFNSRSTGSPPAPTYQNQWHSSTTEAHDSSETSRRILSVLVLAGLDCGAREVAHITAATMGMMIFDWGGAWRYSVAVIPASSPTSARTPTPRFRNDPCPCR